MKEVITTIIAVSILALFIFMIIYVNFIEPLRKYFQDERDAIRKYEIYDGRLFETIIYRYEFYEYFGCCYYKAQLNEIIGNKKIKRKTIKTDKENLIQRAGAMLLDYLVEEVKAEIEEKTFEKMLDNFAEM